MRMSLPEISACLNLDAQFPDTEITGVCTDNRNCKSGDLFICIPGNRVDGHDFARGAVKNGARAVLAQKEIPDPGVPVLRVDNTVKALGGLAGYWRQKSGAKVIGITGTAGKTTLKETLRHIFNQKGTVAATEKNHNNQIGLPCAILSATGDEDWWIMEMGISHSGDMEELGEILKPDFALILNASLGHTEGLGERGVAWHKSRIFNYLSNNGIAICSADYEDLVKECGKLPVNINYFSIKNDNTRWHLVKNGGKGEYTYRFPDGLNTFQTPFIGEFGAETALAAAVIANLAGLNGVEIQKGFSETVMPEDRLNCEKMDNWNIFNDTYNANPLSMKRMIEAAREFAPQNRLLLVLGEMGELGKESSRQHFELGKTAANYKPDLVFWHGAHDQEVLRGLKEGGFNPEFFFPVTEPGDLANFWHKHQNDLDLNGGTILFKGSRSQRMERFLDVFENMLIQGRKNVL